MLNLHMNKNPYVNQKFRIIKKLQVK